MNTETEKHDLAITRTFDAPAAEVWKIWSDPGYVKRWWGPDIFTCPLARIDFREGGTSLVCMNAPRFGDMYSTWRYTKIEPMKLIEFIHNLADSDGNALDPVALGMPSDFPRDQRQTVTLTPVGDDRTEMTVMEYGWTEGRMMDMARMGMEQCMNKMAAILAGPPPGTD
ncbi:MAG: hypothetical protein JWQ98_96 [Chlorobi bacterium]|nr:hypothetical protein [Chlorobiota bacterium]